MSDFVIIHKLEVLCCIGCSEQERAFRQRLLVSARLAVDTRKAGKSGCLEDSVNYAAVCDHMREVAMSRSFVLVEELAETLAGALLLEFSLSSGVHLTIEKFVLPGVEWVGVEIHRSR